ncbi:MAG: PASTA domain-containing protein [Eggerthellaceae bacterium]|jgi:beta-lactam-binding protein with PASTA domain
MSMICPICHNENRDGAKFCDSCGFPLSGKLFAVAEATADSETDKARSLDDSSFRAEEENQLLETIRASAPVKRGFRVSAQPLDDDLFDSDPFGEGASAKDANDGNNASGEESASASASVEDAKRDADETASAGDGDKAFDPHAPQGTDDASKKDASSSTKHVDASSSDAEEDAEAKQGSAEEGSANDSDDASDNAEAADKAHAAGTADPDTEASSDDVAADEGESDSRDESEDAHSDDEPTGESSEGHEAFDGDGEGQEPEQAGKTTLDSVDAAKDDAEKPAQDAIRRHGSMMLPELALGQDDKPLHEQSRLPHLPTIDLASDDADSGDSAANSGKIDPSLLVEGPEAVELSIPSVAEPDEEALQALEQEVDQESNEFSRVAAMARDITADRQADRKIASAAHTSADKTQLLEPVSDSDKTVAIDALERKREEAEGSIAREAHRAKSRFDFSGFDEMVYSDADLEATGERLVSSDYEAPKPNFRDGSTMKIPKVEGAPEPENRDYLSSSTKHRGISRRAVLGICGGLVVAAAITAGVTYQMELWGGTTVPSVEGMSQEDATAALEEAGFTVRTTQIKSDDTAGIVVVEDPAGGSRETSGSEVVLHLATPRTIPSVVNGTEDDARSALTEAGYVNVTYTYQKSDETSGTVLSISPDEGSEAKSTTEITVTVAEPYTVPDVSGMTVTQAENAINAEGLTYTTTRLYTEDYTDGSIIGTDPAAGTSVLSGSTVTIQIARSRSAELVAATQSYLTSGRTITLNGTSYEIVSLDSVQYGGNSTTTFTATARPYASLLGERVYTSNRSISGTIVWSDSNDVISVS